MFNTKLPVVAAAAALAVASAASAVVVEPDDFAAGTDISAAAGGVTLSLGGSNFLADGIFSAELADFATTGDQVFGNSTSGGEVRTNFIGRSTILLNADFDVPATSVSLDFVGAPGVSGVNEGLLRAFDASGAQIDFDVSATLGEGDVETLTVTSADGLIASITAGGNTAGSRVVLDNLNFTPVPEPATLGLLAAAGLGLIRRR